MLLASSKSFGLFIRYSHSCFIMVRMVYQPTLVNASGMFYSHLKGCYCIYGHKCVRHYPAYDFMCPAISYLLPGVGTLRRHPFQCILCLPPKLIWMVDFNWSYFDLSYCAVKKLIIFFEMQEIQANVFHFQRKNMRQLGWNIILMEWNIVFYMIIIQKSFIFNDKLNVSFTFYDR